MSEPTRIQRKRTRDWRKPEGAVYVGRGSEFGNNYQVKKYENIAWVVYNKFLDSTFGPYADKRIANARAVELFERDQLPGMDVSGLRGKTVMCFCGLDMPCHGDSIICKANA